MTIRADLAKSFCMRESPIPERTLYNLPICLVEKETSISVERLNVAEYDFFSFIYN